MATVQKIAQPPRVVKSTRSRSGCLTCRKRHQKCDETKPHCINCQLRGVECGGYSIRLTDFTACSGPNGQLQMVSRLSRDIPGTQLRPKPRRARQMEELGRNERTRIPKLTSPSPRTPVTDTDIDADTDQTDVSLINPADHMFMDDAMTLHADPMQEQYSEFSQEHANATEIGNSNLPTLEWRGSDTFTDAGGSQASSWATGAINPAQPGLFDQRRTLSDFVRWNTPERRPAAAMLPYQHAQSHICPSSDKSSCYFDEDAGDFVRSERCNQSGRPSSQGRCDSFNSQPMHKTLVLHKSLSSFELYLLNHFLTHVAPRFLPTVESERNPYGTVYGNLARESLPLRNVLIFASALHLTKLGQLPNEVIRTHRVAMRDSFRNAVRLTEDTWALGMTVLLSIVLDVIGTGMDSWSSKLIGCRRLLEHGFRKMKGRVSAEMNCVRVQYNWMSTMGRALLLGMQYPHTMAGLAPIDRAEDDEDDDADLAIQQHHWWANMPDFSMHLLLREATDLAIEIERIRSQPGNYDELLRLMPRAADLVQDITSWQPGPASVTPDYVTDETHFNNIWRQGMLCFVYHEIYWLRSSDPLIQACVHASLDSFQKLSWLQACLWPAFMIAVHACTEKARLCYETRLRRMHTTLNFTAPLSIVLVLKNIWDTLDDDDTGVKRWKDVVVGLELELNILL
ncbi:fungal-specific transcription factor domain-containing protein [Boeremia exigua]|uniref:fungal-specific transcription factor domain-containing protein n=1 Tax=Boeremia exigua TaxID=749465 RepID=UPI001E8DED78|nr:fungal-specific transcription factor domain-containing protein [Boeremia exigua]KAH6612979.1 fungal-specific transcription factor domain-containing protein [Boeremia exigua]